MPRSLYLYFCRKISPQNIFPNKISFFKFMHGTTQVVAPTIGSKLSSSAGK